MAYSRNPIWEDLPSTNTPIYASSLNHIEDGLVAAAAKADAPQWGEIQNRPDTFTPTIGVTGTTAKAGNWNPAVTDINATGTRSSTTFLRGDGTWATPAGSGGGGYDPTLPLSIKANVAPSDASVAVNEATIWFDPTNGVAALMVKAKQADGTVKTGSVPLATGTTSPSPLNIITPEMAGASTGAADNTTALNAMLADGRTVHMTAGAVYKTLGTLNVPSGARVIGNNATIDMSGMALGSSGVQRLGMSANGSLGTAVTISTAIAKNSRIIVGIGSTAGLLPGDMILINNQESPVPGMTRSDRDKGELAIIDTVDSATQITLSSGTTFAYGNTSLQLRKINAVQNINITGLRFKCGGVGSGHAAIEVYAGRHIHFDDLMIDGAEDIAVNMRMVRDGSVTRCDLRNSPSPSYTTTGYLVCVVEGSRDVLVENNQMYNARHWVTGGGQYPTTHITVSKNRGSKATASAYDTHESCFHWTFRGNSAKGVSNGFGMRGQHIIVENNLVMDATTNAYEAKTFDLVSEQRGIRFLNNRAYNSPGGIVLDGAAHSPDPECPKIGCEVRGNIVIDCGTVAADAMLIRNFDGMKVLDNVIENAGRNGALILGVASGQSKNLELRGNTVTNAGNHGFDLQLIDGITYGGGSITTPAKFGYSITNCNRTQGVGPNVWTPGQAGITITNGTIHTITAPFITGGTNTSYSAIRGIGLTYLTIDGGGYLNAGQNSIYTTTSDYITVGDVTCIKPISVDAANQTLPGGGYVTQADLDALEASFPTSVSQLSGTIAVAQMAPGSVLRVRWSGTAWPSSPTGGRNDISVDWVDEIGSSTAPPAVPSRGDQYLKVNP